MSDERERFIQSQQAEFAARLRAVWDHAQDRPGFEGDKMMMSEEQPWRYVPRSIVPSSTEWMAFDRKQQKFLVAEELLAIPLASLQNELHYDA